MIDESADDRVAAGGVVAVNGDGQNEARHFARGDTWGITVVSLHNVPPEVAAFRDDVHFLPAILPNVTGEEEPGGAVERKAPGVAQTVRPNLRQPAAVHKRVVRWDRVLFARGKRRVHSDPQNFGEQGARVLTVALRVAAAATIAKSDVEKSVGTEGELPTVVVVVGLIDHQHRPFAPWVCLVRTGRGDLIFSNDRLKLSSTTRALRVVNIESAIRAETRVDRKSVV